MFVDIILEPCFQAPQVDVLADTALQFPAVVVDELAGQDNQTALARLKAAVEHLGQLAGEAGTGGVGKLAGRVEHNARFGGVGHHIFQVIGLRQSHHGIEIRSGIRGIQAPGNGGDHPLAVDLLSGHIAPEVQGVEPLLLIQQLDLGFPPMAAPGLHQNAFAVPACLFVGYVEPIVGERPEEIALAELKHLFRGVFQDVSVVAGCFQYRVV